MLECPDLVATAQFATMSGEETGAVKVHRERIQAILDKASEVKPDGNIEPPLTEADLGERIWHLNIENSSDATGHGEQTSYAAVETAFREKFYDLIVSPMEFLLCRSLPKIKY